MSNLADQIQKFSAEARTCIEAASSAQLLEDARVKYLGRKGGLRDFWDHMKSAPAEEKKELGQLLNKVKMDLETLLEGKLRTFGSALAKTFGPQVDVTLPGKKPLIGVRHIINQTMEEILSIFRHMGFEVLQGPEIEDDFHNFEALNIPKHHPARETSDNFYIDDDRLLRTQTSPGQIRIMETRKPPIRMVVPGRVYRPDTVDATHFYMFHQIEGLVVGDGVTMADLKGTLGLWLKEMFGEDVKYRFRPNHFPFTEPSAEVDCSCPRCAGSGCPVCKNTGWVEVLGCGMVHPNVFKAVGYDPATSGFAFGMGVERLAMRKYRIPDIRYLFENDIRFLEQF